MHTNFRSAEHHPVQQNLQLLERGLSRTNHPTLLYRSEDFVIPKARLKYCEFGEHDLNTGNYTYMLHRRMTAIFFESVLYGRVQGTKLTVAAAFVTELPVQ